MDICIRAEDVPSAILLHSSRQASLSRVDLGKMNSKTTQKDSSFFHYFTNNYRIICLVTSLFFGLIMGIYIGHEIINCRNKKLIDAEQLLREDIHLETEIKKDADKE